MKRNSKIAQQKLRSQKQNTKTTKNLLPYFVLIGVILLGFVSWLVFSDAGRKSNPFAAESFLTSNNAVACVTVEAIRLECENLQTGEVRRFNLPQKYHNAAEIMPSPDGTKLIVQTTAGEAVVTDTSFNELAKVFKTGELKDRHVAYSWVSGSEQILIREIRREQGDADFLPEPIVVRLFDLKTGEHRRIYKTGERGDVDSIQALGGNSEYIFIGLPTAKNWVAQETESPFNAIHAIRYLGGFVQPINTYQVSQTAKDQRLRDTVRSYYDASRDLFVFIGQRDSSTEGSLEGYIVMARLGFGAYGPELRKVYESASGANRGYQSVFTTKGMQLEDFSEASDHFKLVDDNGKVTDLKLAKDKYGMLLSLQTMPNLPQAD